MKKLIKYFLPIVSIITTTFLHSENVVTIRDDRVILLNSKPFFPLGVYCEVMSRYDELENAGFNLINLDWGTYQMQIGGSRGMISVAGLPSLTYVNPANANRVLNDANTHNLLILSDFMPFHEDATTFDGQPVSIDQTFRNQAVDNLKTWDVIDNGAFLGWYSRDEPVWSIDLVYGTPGNYDITAVSNRFNNMLLPTYNHVKSHDPNHIVFMDFSYAHDSRFAPTNYTYEQARAQYVADIQLYSGAADIIAHDVYPIWLWGCGTYLNPSPLFYGDVKYKLFENDEISLVGDYTKLLVDAVNKPVFAVLESYIPINSGRNNRSWATMPRLRFEAYQAIVNGATGLIWYGWFNELPTSSIWASWKTIVHDEFSESTPTSLYPVLTARNSSLNISVAESGVDIEWLLKEYAGYYYLIAVNRFHNNGSATFSGFSSTVSTGEVKFESRNITLSGGSFTDSFDAFGVHVYKIFQTSGLIREDATWGPGTIPYITGDITLSDNAELTILPGTIIKFSGYYTMTVQSGAKIIAEGTSSSPITFISASGNLTNQWKWIELQGGNNVFKYCNCSYGQYSFFLNSCTSSEGTANLFQNCSFKYNSVYGIRFDNSVAKLVTCEIDDNNQIGVRSYISTVDFTGNGICRNKSHGIYSPGRSSLQFYGTVIENNTNYGLLANYGDHIHIGKPYDWYGYNTIQKNNNTEVYASSGSPGPTVEMNYSSIHDDTGGLEVYNASGNPQIFTQNCYWGPDYVCNKSGDVYVQYPWTTKPDWDGTTRSSDGPFYKVLSPEIDTDKFLIDPSLPQEDQIEQCKSLIASGLDKKEATAALDILYGILRPDYIKNELGERDSFREYVGSLWNSHKDKAVGRRALQYMIIWDILAGDDDQAIEFSKKALKVLEKLDANCVTYDLAYAYLRKGWTENAKGCLESLKGQMDSKENAIWQLEEDIRETEDRIVKGLIQSDESQHESQPSETDEALSEEIALLQNYPNPGNPTTLIQYQLIEARRVVLKIFNILGEEVATLIDRQEEAGVHQVIWDGKDKNGFSVPTGLYIYRLETGDQAFTRKLMLVK